MSVALVFGKLRLPPRRFSPVDNLVHLTPDERADGRPCVCEDCCRQRPERRLLKIKQRAEILAALRFCERL